MKIIQRENADALNDQPGRISGSKAKLELEVWNNHAETNRNIFISNSRIIWNSCFCLIDKICLTFDASIKLANFDKVGQWKAEENDIKPKI